MPLCKNTNISLSDCKSKSSIRNLGCNRMADNEWKKMNRQAIGFLNNGYKFIWRIGVYLDGVP